MASETISMSAPESIRAAGELGGISKEPYKRLLEASTSGVTVAIGHFDALTHHGLTAVLDEDRSICVVASGLEGPELEDVVVRETPHIVILDETTERLRLEHMKAIAPASGLLVLAHEPSRAYRTAVLAAGAACLARAVSAADLLAAVHLVARGEAVFTSGDGHQVEHRRLDGTHLLTNRELDVLGHLSQARADAEIALHLNISVTTVRAHVRAVRRKLNVKSRQELVGMSFKKRRHEG
jgi:DNA-binding NarL/FixJ family response regulator